MPLVSFSTAWKPLVFLMFSGGIERYQWHEMSLGKIQNRNNFLFGRFCALWYSYVEGNLTSLTQRNVACQFQLANYTVLKEVVNIFQAFLKDGMPMELVSKINLIDMASKDGYVGFVSWLICLFWRLVFILELILVYTMQMQVLKSYSLVEQSQWSWITTRDGKK